MSQADVRFKTFSEYRGPNTSKLTRRSLTGVIACDDWWRIASKMKRKGLRHSCTRNRLGLHNSCTRNQLEWKEIGSTPHQLKHQLILYTQLWCRGHQISLRRIMCTATSTQREQSYRSYSIFQKFVFSQHCSCFQVSRMDTMEWINCRSHDTLLSLFSVLVSLVQRPVSTCIHNVEKSYVWI